MTEAKIRKKNNLQKKAFEFDVQQKVFQLGCFMVCSN